MIRICQTAIDPNMFSRLCFWLNFFRNFVIFIQGSNFIVWQNFTKIQLAEMKFNPGVRYHPIFF